MQKDLLWWSIGLLLGLSIVILTFNSNKYLDWTWGPWILIGGMVLSGMVLAVLRPDRVWRWCIANGFGVTIGVVLWGNLQSLPLSPAESTDLIIPIIFWTVLFGVPAFSGAWIGVTIRSLYIKLLMQKIPEGTQPQVRINPIGLIRTVVALIMITLMALAIPLYVKMVKYNRTVLTMIQVESIYSALAKWQDDPELGDGTLPSDITTMGKDGKTFLQHFPDDTKCLTNPNKCDTYYAYTFEEATGPDGKIVPKVMATTKDSSQVRGEIIISLPGGEAEVIKVSDSY